VNRSDCYTSPCAWIDVSASGFSPNRNVTVVCSSSRETAFWTYTLATDGSGNASGAGCYYGYPGDSVWVDVDGVRSNIITW
jgi:rhodanese-related sulfurtransferase